MLQTAAVQVNQYDPMHSVSKSRSQSRTAPRDNESRSQDPPRENDRPPRREQSHHESSHPECCLSIHDARHNLPPCKDTWEIIENRRMEHARQEAENNYDVFPAFTPCITDSTYPVGFKPPPIDKYDGKMDPQIWL